MNREELLGDTGVFGEIARRITASRGQEPQDTSTHHTTLLQEETKCQTCNDYGRVVHDVPHDHPDFGESFPCPDCSGDFDKIGMILKYSGIPEEYQSVSFENFEQRRGSETNYKDALSLTTGEEGVFMVLLLGGNGNGKTSLAYASGMDAINKGIPVKFIRCDLLMRDFKAAKSQESEGQLLYSKLFSRYAQVPYLILDEFDWDSDADIRMLEKLVCERVVNRLMTLITTNRNLFILEDKFPRMMSRLKDRRFSRISFNQASDYRLEA